MGYPLTVLVPHAIEILWPRHVQCTWPIIGLRSTSSWSWHVTIRRCLVLNPATLMSMPCTDEDSECEYDCLEVTDICTIPRLDIRDVLLAEALFVDGSCLRDEWGILKAAYAVCALDGVVEASYLCHVKSAQVAELIAITRACYVLWLRAAMVTKGLYDIFWYPHTQWTVCSQPLDSNSNACRNSSCKMCCT